VSFNEDKGTTTLYFHLITNIKKLTIKVLVPFHATLCNFTGSKKLSERADFRTMASPISFLQPSLFLAAAFHYRICSKSMASLQRAPPPPPSSRLSHRPSSSTYSTSILGQCFSTAGPWHQLYRAARICHFNFLSIFHE
jgi:hypothetical protein